MTKSFAQTLSDARLMVAGVSQNLDALKAIGISDSDLAALEAALAETSALDVEQEKLKADLKDCTAKLGDASKALTGQLAAVKKRVKLAIPQTRWKEFGIADSR